MDNMNKLNRKQIIIKGIIKIAAAIVCVLVSNRCDYSFLGKWYESK